MPGAQELLIIALVALFVLGPERLPEVARGASRLLTRIRNYGVTAAKELRGVADLGDIEREVSDLRRELERTRLDLRRAMRETVASSRSVPSGAAARAVAPELMTDGALDAASDDAPRAVETAPGASGASGAPDASGASGASGAPDASDAPDAPGERT